MIINEYNNWRSRGSLNPLDTSATLHGIADANRYFKTKKVFWVMSLTSSAFVLPGIVTAQVVLNKKPKPSELNIPQESVYHNDQKYIEGYEMRAMYKKSRAIQRGFYTGIAICTVVEFFALI